MKFVAYFFSRTDEGRRELKTVIIESANQDFALDVFDELYPFHKLDEMTPYIDNESEIIA